MDQNTRILGWNQPLLCCFSEVRDPRVRGRCLHPLINIIAITLCAVVCGANGWKAIAEFGAARFHWLKQFLNLPHGIPSAVTIARVFSLLDPDEFQRAFMEWVSTVCKLLEEDIINIDGKTVCGSAHENGNKPALHLINAFACRQKMTLGCVKTPDHSNEIKGIPRLLKLLNPKGCIITLDAMGTQRGIANLIRLREANYVLALKENHRRFYRKVNRLFEKAADCHYQGMVYRRWKTKSYDHSRLEEREYTILPMMYLHSYKRQWKDLQLFIRVKATRSVKERIETSTRYYISSIPFARYHKAAQAIREHWHVENSLHWKLDVGLHEDDCPIYRGHAAENLATVRKIVLQLLQHEHSYQAGIALKRLKAALNTRYLRKVVGF